MPSSKTTIPSGVTREHIVAAIERIDRTGHAPHGASVRYVVEHEGKQYPPIAVAAFAIEAHTGESVAKGSLPGGSNTATFTMLREAGFSPRAK